MIAAVVVVPSAPALLPRYVGRDDALADLRAMAVDAIRDGCAGIERVVLVAATDREPRHTMAPLGRRVGEHLLLLAGAAADDAALVPWDASPVECHAIGTGLATGGAASAIATGGAASATATAGAASAIATGAGPSPRGVGTASSALVVVADGSARRGEKAPGHLDERAFAFDDALVAALGGADPAALLALDATRAADLLADGRAPLQVAAAAMARRGAPQALHSDGTATPGTSQSLPSDAAPPASVCSVGDTGAVPEWRCERLEVSDPFGVLHAVALLRHSD
ncbi:MAG: hypothetical protein ACRCYR_09375 [Phycicoccus sp.]